VLNGGLEAWTNVGKKLATEPTIKPAATFKSKFVKSRIATTEEILKIAKDQVKGVQLIRSRSKKEYSGEDIRSIRGGRIPNCTLNVPHEETYDQVKDPATGKDKSTGLLSYERVAKPMRSSTRIRAQLPTARPAPAPRSPTWKCGCSIKDRANYDDSWIVYSVQDKFPVEEEQLIDLSRSTSLKRM